ncbi:MAG: carboxypeptidase-like regulatory domain-containing protein [Polyangiaceae bacterium]
MTVTAAPDSGVSPPFNTCPAHPCAAYQQTPAPTCSGGACLEGSLPSGLVIVVSLPTDSDFAPSQNVTLGYPLVLPKVACTSPTIPCAELPNYALVQGQYTVTQQFQSPAYLNWNLGNPSAPTALPVHVTYQPLWSIGSNDPVEANSVGLPLDPIAAFVIEETSPSSPPGPAMGPSIGFQANLEQGSYRLTIQPDPPFDVAFPPEVENVPLVTGTQNEFDALVPDTTTKLTDAPQSGPIIPEFSVFRVPDGLSGWQAYLRDETTLQRVSPVATLGTRTNDCASTACTVVLPTNHHPADGDALTGTQLVIAPPADLGLPAYVPSTDVQFTYRQPIPTMAPAQTVSGKVTGLESAEAGVVPVEAEIYFEVSTTDTTTGVWATPVGATALAFIDINFEYSAHTTASIDPTTGDATYSISLVPGVYRVTARPLDSVHQVTPVASFNVDPTAGATSPDIAVDVLRSVTGNVAVSDTRPMAGASVQATPVSCATGGSDASCMPRSGETTTDADGNYQMSLDPGGYTLTIEPQSGTLFPWVTQPVLVQATPTTTVPTIFVPAPVYAGLQLFDPYGNVVSGAVVRVYQPPTATASAIQPAVLIGEAFTDATGTYDLFLAPATQAMSSSP